MLNEAPMLESHYNAIIDTPEMADYVFHRLLPGITLISLLGIAIIVLIVFVWIRCKRRKASLLLLLAAIIVGSDLLLIYADYVMAHYCLTGENLVYKYGTAISRSLNGEYYYYCLWWKPILVNVLSVIFLALVLRIDKMKNPLKR